MSQRRVHVGQASLVGRLGKYAKVFDFLEVRCDPAPPSPKHLRRLREEAPEGFAFALVAGKALSALSTTEPDAKLVSALREAATALGARWILVRTPASATPSSRTRGRLASLFGALAGAAPGIAWEPRGIWSDDELARAREEFGVTVVRDLAEHDAVPADVVYTRLLGLGRNQRIGSGAIERLEERLEGVSTAFVIVEGQGAVAVSRALRGVSENEDDEDEDADDEDGEDGEDGDEEGGDEEGGDEEGGDDELGGDEDEDDDDEDEDDEDDEDDR